MLVPPGGKDSLTTASSIVRCPLTQTLWKFQKNCLKRGQTSDNSTKEIKQILLILCPLKKTGVLFCLHFSLSGQSIKICTSLPTSTRTSTALAILNFGGNTVVDGKNRREWFVGVQYTTACADVKLVGLLFVNDTWYYVGHSCGE